MTVGILGALELQQILAERLAGCRPNPAATTAALAGLGTVGLGLGMVGLVGLALCLCQ